MNEIENNYLEHHGILGQKWHKRNGPPYPLGASDHSKSEKEAGYKKSLNGGHNEELYDRNTQKKRAKKYSKIEAKSASEFRKVVSEDKNINEFVKNNKKAKEFHKAIDEQIDLENTLHQETNEYARKKAGVKDNESFIDLLYSNKKEDVERLNTYMKAGVEYVNTEIYKNRVEEGNKKYEEKRRAWEKEGREYAEKLLGEYGNVKSKNKMSVKFDLKTKKLSRQTLNDRLGYEIYDYGINTYKRGKK